DGVLHLLQGLRLCRALADATGNGRTFSNPYSILVAINGDGELHDASPHIAHSQEFISRSIHFAPISNDGPSEKWIPNSSRLDNIDRTLEHCVKHSFRLKYLSNRSSSPSKVTNTSISLVSEKSSGAAEPIRSSRRKDKSVHIVSISDLKGARSIMVAVLCNNHGMLLQMPSHNARTRILCMLPPSTSTLCDYWLSALKVFAREPALLELAVQEDLEKVSHAFVVLGVDVIVPLLEPRDECGHTSE